MPRRPMPSTPQRILLIKSHSAGIGDILRSSAAWAVLKKRWPEARLRLLFLNRWPGYPSEELIADHPLLEAAHFLSMREGRWAGMRGVGPQTWRQLLPQLRQIAEEYTPDLLIDHEPHGLETLLVTRYLRRQCPAAASIGVAQVPGRGLLYDHAGPSLERYAREAGLALPLDYTERDFAALRALGLARQGQSIVLSVTAKGKRWQQEHLSRFAGRRLLGLNIGCATSGAENKRPSLELLVEALAPDYLPSEIPLLLTGAPNEREINQQFLVLYRRRWGADREVVDFAGQTSLSQLTGLIAACSLFVSSDSGPYHMAVALGVRSLVIFNFANPSAYHHQDNVQTLINPTPTMVGEQILQFLSQGRLP